MSEESIAHTSISLCRQSCWPTRTDMGSHGRVCQCSAPATAHNRLRVIAGEIGLAKVNASDSLTTLASTHAQTQAPSQLSNDGVAQLFCSSLRHTLIFSNARPNYLQKCFDSECKMVTQNTNDPYMLSLTRRPQSPKGHEKLKLLCQWPSRATT